ncbi:MAG: DNA repair protein RadC [Candidatus Firestonebacteria bacterium]
MNEEKKGHRGRLRKRFNEDGLGGFLDYEIVELLLTLGTPRKDCKKQAHEAIKRFGSLRGVLEADQLQLQKITGIGPLNTFGLRLVHESTKKFLEEKLIDKEQFCRSSKEVFDYLYHSMRGLKYEVFKVIYLSSQNKVIKIKDLFEGSLTSTSIYPREIIKSSIQKNAVALIFVHNHPSGEPQPSDLDKEITENLVSACKIMEINVIDHIIIGNNKYYSFADNGLIKEYKITRRK